MCQESAIPAVAFLGKLLLPFVGVHIYWRVGIRLSVALGKLQVAEMAAYLTVGYAR